MKRAAAAFTLIFLICTFLNASICAAREFHATLIYDDMEHEYTGAYFSVAVDGKRIDSPIPPIVLEKDRALVAIREIFESLGAEVEWTPGKPGKADISYDGSTVSVTIDNKTAYVNGRAVEMETAAKIIAYNGTGKTMVPVRFVAETLGMEVSFDSAADTISIYTPISPPASDKKLVNSIESANEGNIFTAKIALSAPHASYNIMTLNAPNRVVLDIKGFSTEKLKGVYSADGNTDRIRTGDYEGSARIVFDVDKNPKYSASFSEDEKTLTIILTAPEIKEDNPPAASGPKIVIDAGHGGSDPGAIGYNEDGTADLQEKDVTLVIANRLYQILKENGVDAYYTRNTDVYVTLAERAEFANRIGASLFVSVHCNAFTSSDVYGSLVMHHTSKDTSSYGISGQDLASNILRYLPDALGTKNRGRVDGSAMYVIRKVDMPSVIVETAFITNPSDRAKLHSTDMQEAAAQAIAKGIMDTIPKLKR